MPLWKVNKHVFVSASGPLTIKYKLDETRSWQILVIPNHDGVVDPLAEDLSHLIQGGQGKGGDHHGPERGLKP